MTYIPLLSIRENSEYGPMFLVVKELEKFILL